MRSPPRLLRSISVILASALLLSACDYGGEISGDSTPPSTPSGLTARSEDGAVELAWNASKASDLDGYNVYRSTSPSDSLDGFKTVNGSSPVPGTTFTDTNVLNGTVYYYYVTSTNDNKNESEKSNMVEVTPFSPPPSRP